MKSCLVSLHFSCPVVVKSIHFESEIKGHLSYNVSFSGCLGEFYTQVLMWNFIITCKSSGL